MFVQATVFEDVLPTGLGVIAVRTPEEATDALAEIRGDYARHAAAARELAREHFDGTRLLGEALDLAGIPSSRSRA